MPDSVASTTGQLLLGSKAAKRQVAGGATKKLYGVKENRRPVNGKALWAVRAVLQELRKLTHSKASVGGLNNQHCNVAPKKPPVLVLLTHHSAKAVAPVTGQPAQLRPLVEEVPGARSALTRRSHPICARVLQLFAVAWRATSASYAKLPVKLCVDGGGVKGVSSRRSQLAPILPVRKYGVWLAQLTVHQRHDKGQVLLASILQQLSHRCQPVLWPQHIHYVAYTLCTNLSQCLLPARCGQQEVHF